MRVSETDLADTECPYFTRELLQHGITPAARHDLYSSNNYVFIGAILGEPHTSHTSVQS